MKKHNAKKITTFFLGISLAIVFHCALPSKIMAYGAPYDAFGINLDGSIVAPGGAGYPPLYSNNGYQWSYSPSYGYGYPLSYYNSYDGFGYQQFYTPYSYQQSYNPYGYQQQPYSYGWGQPSYGWDAYNYMYPSNYNPYSYTMNQPSYGWDVYRYMYPSYYPDTYEYQNTYHWISDPINGNQYVPIGYGNPYALAKQVPGGYIVPGQGFVAAQGMYH